MCSHCVDELELCLKAAFQNLQTTVGGHGHVGVVVPRGRAHGIAVAVVSLPLQTVGTGHGPVETLFQSVVDVLFLVHFPGVSFQAAVGGAVHGGRALRIGSAVRTSAVSGSAVQAVAGTRLFGRISRIGRVVDAARADGWKTFRHGFVEFFAFFDQELDLIIVIIVVMK